MTLASNLQLWAARQAYAANHVDPEKQFLVLNLAQNPEHRTVLHSTHFQNFEESQPASKVLHTPFSIIKNKSMIQNAFCCTRLSVVRRFSACQWKCGGVPCPVAPISDDLSLK